MLEGKLLDADERKRLEAAVKRTRWSWTNTAEFFGIRMDQMSGVRHGKRPWPPRFTEYLEAVADAIEGVPVPAPQGQKEVEVGRIIEERFVTYPDGSPMPSPTFFLVNEAPAERML